MADRRQHIETTLQRALSTGAPVHASAICHQGQGLLVLGASGQGKSALALQLIAYGAELVADDGVCLSEGPAGIALSCPPAIRGRIEARGLGILSAPFVEAARLALIVDLDSESPARLPPAQVITLVGHSVPLFARVDGAHFPAALLLALRGGLPVEEAAQQAAQQTGHKDGSR